MTAKDKLKYSLWNLDRGISRTNGLSDNSLDKNFTYNLIYNKDSKNYPLIFKEYSSLDEQAVISFNIEQSEEYTDYRTFEEVFYRLYQDCKYFNVKSYHFYNLFGILYDINLNPLFYVSVIEEGNIITVRLNINNSVYTSKDKLPVFIMKKVIPTFLEIKENNFNLPYRDRDRNTIIKKEIVFNELNEVKLLKPTFNPNIDKTIEFLNLPEEIKKEDIKFDTMIDYEITEPIPENNIENLNVNTTNLVEWIGLSNS